MKANIFVHLLLSDVIDQLAMHKSKARIKQQSSSWHINTCKLMWFFCDYTTVILSGDCENPQFLGGSENLLHFIDGKHWSGRVCTRLCRPSPSLLRVASHRREALCSLGVNRKRPVVYADMVKKLTSSKLLKFFGEFHFLTFAFYNVKSSSL